MGYDLYFADDDAPGAEAYFRIGIGGMGELRYALHAAGVLTTEAPPRELDDGSDEGHERLRTWEGPGSGIPVHKLGSNDGWLVTPAECRAVADRFGSLDAAALDAVAIDGILGDRLADALVRARADGVPIDAITESPSIEPVNDDDLADSKEFLLSFADYCRRAADHGGFTVG